MASWKSASSQSVAWSRHRGPLVSVDHEPSSSAGGAGGGGSPPRIMGTSPVAGSVQWGRGMLPELSPVGIGGEVTRGYSPLGRGSSKVSHGEAPTGSRSKPTSSSGGQKSDDGPPGADGGGGQASSSSAVVDP